MDTDTRFAVTQADIDAVKHEIASQKYAKPNHNNIYNITDTNISVFK